MIDVRVTITRKPHLDASVVHREASALADELLKLLVAHNQLALLHYHKKVSGDTLRAVQGRNLQNTAALQRRQVVGGAGYKFIRDGRRAGAKMPVRFVGTGIRGGKIFEPVPLLMRWFVLKGIPRSAWFPICRKIARKGIKPTPIDTHAISTARSSMRRAAQAAGARIARGIIRYGN